MSKTASKQSKEKKKKDKKDHPKTGKDAKVKTKVEENDNKSVSEDREEDENKVEKIEKSKQKEEKKEETKSEEVDYKQKYYYLAAEMENTRKRFLREKEKLIKFGNERILSSLIEVVDNLDHSINGIQETEDDKIKNIANGITMVRDQFLKVLKENGMETVKSVGVIFDPQYHEAVAQQPAEGKKEQEIITEYQKGYVLNGRLLRAAKVVITKND